MGKRPMLSNMYLVSALATVGGLLQGFDVSSMSAIIGTNQYKRYFHKPDSVLQGGITASMAAGSFLGSMITNYTGDRIGRRDSLAIGCVVFIIGSTLMAATQDVAMLIVARIVNGVAVGILSAQAPLYIAEIATPTARGRLISLQQWSITWGILLMYYISYGTSFVYNTASFRIPWAVQMVPAIVLLSAVNFMPRSPRWLASKDRWDEAHEVLARLHAKGNLYDPLVLAELQEIKDKVFAEKSYTSSWSELVTRKNFPRVSSAIFAHVWSQFSGMNVLMYYIVYIFEMAGISGNRGLYSASIQYCINIVMTLLALAFIDRWRRRWLLMLGSSLMALWLFIEAGLMAGFGHAVPGGLPGSPTVTWVINDSAASKAIISCSFLFVASYAPTWGPGGWVYPSEILPLYIRSKTLAVAVGANWLGNFALTFFTPPAFQNIRWKTFLIFGTFNIASLLHVFLFFQETKGKTLEEMDEVFAQSVWAFKVPYTESKLVEEVQRVAKEIDAVKGNDENVEEVGK